MTFINIVEVVASLIVALGGWEAIKYLLNRRANKKKENAEADKELVSLQDSRYSEILQAYKEEVADLKEQVELAQSRMRDKSMLIQELEEKATVLVTDHQQLIETKNARIEELMQKVNQLTSQVTGLMLTKCTVLDCRNRIPPQIGSELVFKDGIPVISKEGE